MKNYFDLKIFKNIKLSLPDDCESGHLLFLQNGLLSNGHFCINMDWLNSLPNQKPVANLLREYSKTQVRDVTSLVSSEKVPTAPKPLEQIISDVKLRNYREAKLEKATPLLEFDPPEKYGKKIPFTQSVRAFALKSPVHPVAVEINANYMALLLLDPEAKVLLKNFQKPVAVVKNGVTVAILMPMQSMTTIKWESKNAKDK